MNHIIYIYIVVYHVYNIHIYIYTDIPYLMLSNIPTYYCTIIVYICKYIYSLYIPIYHKPPVKPHPTIDKPLNGMKQLL